MPGSAGPASGVCSACGEPGAAAGVLLKAVRVGEDLLIASPVAVRAAAEAVAGLAGPPGDPPSATFVSAVMTCEAGGKDNVTVVLAPFPPAQPASQDPASPHAGLT